MGSPFESGSGKTTSRRGIDRGPIAPPIDGKVSAIAGIEKEWASRSLFRDSVPSFSACGLMSFC